MRLLFLLFAITSLYPCKAQTNAIIDLTGEWRTCKASSVPMVFIFKDKQNGEKGLLRRWNDLSEFVYKTPFSYTLSDAPKDSLTGNPEIDKGLFLITTRSKTLAGKTDVQSFMVHIATKDSIGFVLRHDLITPLCRVKSVDQEAKLKISPLTGDFYVYTTYNTYEGSKVPANGMYLVTSNGVVMFDTPWDTTQFQPLLDSKRIKHNKNVVMCFATHWHSDKTAGLEYYRQQGIKTYTTVLTDELSKKNNKKRAEFLMTKDTAFHVGQYSFQTYYPGPGHTEDNIVIWFSKEKILYGGCLIKGADDENLGFLGDGNPAQYASTLKNVRKQCKNPKFIIVAHSDWRNLNSLDHSIMMAEELKKKTR